MLGIKEGTPLEMLRQFAVYFDGDLREDFGAAKLSLDNHKGKGSITLYEVFSGLTAWVYDITFYSDMHIDLKFSEDRPYYFGYHVEGHQMQKFPNETVHQKIAQGQNFILKSEPGTESEFIIPAEVKFQSCYLIIHSHLLGQNETKIKSQLEDNLGEIFGADYDKTQYRYFGNIDLRVGTYAKLIVENQRTDLVGRLITEAAIMNMLASQITAHDHDSHTDSFQADLTKTELLKVSDLGDYIRENISNKFDIQDIGKYLGLSPKKLQTGVRFLYGYTVNQYLTNIRLEFARELIQSTDMNISEVCYGIGYSSRSYFSKLFKERYGVLPNEFKKSFVKDNLLFEVSYRSMAKTDITAAEIEDILKTSRARNKEYNITGSLIYHRKVFFQLIEGNKTDVLNIYENICDDNRHFDIAPIWQGLKPSREFGDWSMAMLSDDRSLKVSIEGDTKHLNLSHLLGEIDEQSLAAKSLWRKVRNIIKIAS